MSLQIVRPATTDACHREAMLSGRRYPIEQPLGSVGSVFAVEEGELNAIRIK